MREELANYTQPCSQINNIEKASRCQKATTFQGKSIVCVRVEAIYFISLALYDDSLTLAMSCIYSCPYSRHISICIYINLRISRTRNVNIGITFPSMELLMHTL